MLQLFASPFSSAAPFDVAASKRVDGPLNCRAFSCKLDQWSLPFVPANSFLFISFQIQIYVFQMHVYVFQEDPGSINWLAAYASAHLAFACWNNSIGTQCTTKSVNL